MGLNGEITPRGLFPPADDTPELTIAELSALDKWTHNHPSFEATFQDGPPPRVGLVAEYVNAGFGELFESEHEAKLLFGAALRPSPLGTITKEKSDGTMKHRIIQDMRRSSVNGAVRLPVRQVLPRPLDHSRDLSECAPAVHNDNVLHTLTLDFKDAFMSIPLHDDERPLNCTRIEGGVARERASLRGGEPERGDWVVWRVLGFGGKPNTGRLQLYVDDPVLATAGHPRDVEEALDLVLLWWLLLGVPLAWGKGHLSTSGGT